MVAAGGWDILPQMDHLAEAIRDVARRIERGEYQHEAAVSRQIVMRFFRHLGWDEYAPEQVSPEFSIGSRKVDYALCRPPFGAVVLIEVKNLGKATPEGEKQLFDYCFKKGVPLAVLTDGKTWSFYYPAGMGDFEQRRFAELDLTTDDPALAAGMLKRYLAFSAVTASDWQGRVQKDYEAFNQQLVAKEHFSSVAESLFAGEDERLLDLFVEHVERRSGVRPSADRVRGFLKEYATRPKPTPVPKPAPVPTSTPAPKPKPAPLGTEAKTASFTLFGETVTHLRDKEMFLDILRRLVERDASLYEKLSPFLSGRKNPYLSRNRESLYASGSSPQLWSEVAELPGGWWVKTHSSSATKDRQLKKAREVAGLSASQLHWRMKGQV